MRQHALATASRPLLFSSGLPACPPPRTHDPVLAQENTHRDRPTLGTSTSMAATVLPSSFSRM